MGPELSEHGEVDPLLRKTFALDFDETFTSDPLLWSAFVNLARARGHRVVCITSRRSEPENVAELKAAFAEHDLIMPVIFAEMGPKELAAKLAGVHVDIWIDDTPASIGCGK